jgi:hypothetical protein
MRARGLSLRTVLAATIAVLLAPGAAQAACSGKWDLSGSFFAAQTNGVVVTFHLEQDGTSLSGDATVPNPVVSSTSYPIAARSVEGSIEGDSVTLTVYWKGPSIGIYTGTVNSEGYLYGEGYDKLTPESRAGWTSDRKMKRCAN